MSQPHRELASRNNVAMKIAQSAIAATYEEIPPDVVHQTKRVLLDTLGCAIGGYSSDASRIIQEVVSECGHPGEATVFGSGLKSSLGMVALANGAMVRFLDYNDTAFILQGETYRTGYHPSEVIPPILALAEKEGLCGREVIVAINLGYDLSLAFLKGVTGPGMEKRGWNGDTRGAYVMPVVLGRMTGLSPEQIQNAVGIAGSCHAVLGILDTAAEEYTNTKNIRFPTMAQASLQALALARKGFTGPARMVEGEGGFAEVIMGGHYDLQPLLDFKGSWTIRETCLKSIIADFSAHGHLTATLTLAREHDIHPEDVVSIRITTSKRCADHTGDPVKKYPRNKETADHSSYWLTAIAILERAIGPDQFKPEKYADPRALELIEKIILVGDPSLDKERPAGISEITLKDGRLLRKRVDYPRGHARNPMSDQEVESKFRSMASRVMPRDQMERLIETVWKLDELNDVGEITALMVFGGDCRERWGNGEAVRVSG